jgi:hypothetical protein
MDTHGARDAAATPYGERAYARPVRASREEDALAELGEVQQAATVALAVLRRALVEGSPVTREAITHEAEIVYATDPAEAVSKLDSQAEGLGISSLI